MKRIRIVWLLSAALLLAGILAAALFLHGGAEAPAPSDALVQAVEGLPEIAAYVTLLPDGRTLEVLQTMTVQAHAGEDGVPGAGILLYANVLRKSETTPCEDYPNGFSIGSMQVEEVAADGVSVPFQWKNTERTLLFVPCGTSDGDEVQLTLRCRATVPDAVWQFGSAEGMLLLGELLPMAAEWDNGEWQYSEVFSWGQSRSGSFSNWRVQVTVPDGWQCFGSAAAAEEKSENGTVYGFRGLCMRRFALMLTTRRQIRTKTANGVLLTAVASSGADAARLLGEAEKALRCYVSRFGAFPWPALTVADTPLPGEGASYPGLLFTGADGYSLPKLLAMQYWGDAIGTDTFCEPWLAEALSGFSLLDYLEDSGGLSARRNWEQVNILPTQQLAGVSGVTPGASLDVFSSAAEFRRVVQYRGTAFLCAVDLLSEGCADKALRAWWEQSRYRRASREDFRRIAGEALQLDLSPLMTDYLDTNTQ